jgi:hypothetical protein
VWRYTESYVLSTPQKSEMLAKNQKFYVSPDGNVEKAGGVHIVKHIYSGKGKGYGGYDFEQFSLAAGIGLSDYINEENISITKMPNTNQIKINSRGTYGREFKSNGTWELITEPNSHFFITKATFKPEKQDKPMCEVSASDFVDKDELRYPRNAHVVLGDGFLAMHYGDIDISVGYNQQLKQEVIQQVEAPLVPGSEIIDYNDGRPKPKTVK